MKKTLLPVLILFFSIFFASSAMAATALGWWKTIDDKTKTAKSYVYVFKKNGKTHGRIVALIRKAGEVQNPKCDKCKDARKGKYITGMEIIQNMKDNKKTWWGGKILDPKNGKIYRCKFWPVGKSKLKVRGYVLFFFRTQTWLRPNAAEKKKAVALLIKHRGLATAKKLLGAAVVAKNSGAKKAAKRAPAKPAKPAPAKR